MIHVATLILLFGAAASSEQTQKLLDCRAIAEPSARVACYDTAVDALTPKVDPEATFGRETEAADVVQKEFVPPQPESIEARLVARKQNAAGRYVLELDNDQVWVQVESENLVIRPGETVSIKRLRLGGYVLSKIEGSRGVRVKRLQ